MVTPNNIPKKSTIVLNQNVRDDIETLLDSDPFAKDLAVRAIFEMQQEELYNPVDTLYTLKSRLMSDASVGFFPQAIRRFIPLFDKERVVFGSDPEVAWLLYGDKFVYEGISVGRMTAIRTDTLHTYQWVEKNLALAKRAAKTFIRNNYPTAVLVTAPAVNSYNLDTIVDDIHDNISQNNFSKEIVAHLWEKQWAGNLATEWLVANKHRITAPKAKKEPQVSVPRDFIGVYTDASVSRRCDRAGLCVLFTDGEMVRTCVKLTKADSKYVLRAELKALNAAVDAISKREGNDTYLVCSDSLYAINHVRKFFNVLNKGEILVMRNPVEKEAAAVAKKIVSVLRGSNKGLRLSWVKAHTGEDPFNDAVDRVARSTLRESYMSQQQRAGVETITKNILDELEGVDVEQWKEDAMVTYKLSAYSKSVKAARR